jgi:DNA-binding MarR family transcriptional regulator
MLACMQASTASKQAISGDELAVHLATVMKHLMLSTGGDFFQAVEDLSLSLSQIKSLHALNDADAPVPLGELAGRLPLSLPAVSRAIEGLVQRKYVTRQEDPSDRRSKRVLITAKGRQTVEKLFELRKAGLRDFLDELTPEERDALSNGLRPIARRLAE